MAARRSRNSLLRKARPTSVDSRLTISRGVPAGALREFVKRGTSPFYHPVGTARMGADAAAPVTPELRVRGIDNLWVADASVMPQIVPAMTNAAVVAIAERAAELIAGAFG